jgi:threonine synthase
VLEIRGTFDDTLRLARELGAREGFVLVNSLNPDRIEGQKSVAHELVEQLGGAPDVVALPFGGGGNVTAVTAGFTELGASPRVVVGQAAQRETTWASAIRIAEPAHASHVADLVDAGRIDVVTLEEAELRTWWRRLAIEEGTFCEPASAAGVAALARLGVRGSLVAVALLTGHGLKDPEAVEQPSGDPVEPTVEAVLEELR